MEIDVEFGDDEQVEDTAGAIPEDPDEFLARNSLRIVYKSNNFFLPQIRDMITNREAMDKYTKDQI